MQDMTRRVWWAAVLVCVVLLLWGLGGCPADDGASSEVVVLHDSTFKANVLDSEKPAIVDFWATWCGPCKMQAPIIEKIAQKYASKVLVGKLDVDSAPKTAQAYGVTAIPTLVLFKNGHEVKRFVGLQQEETLVQAIETNLLQ